jgi:hypothetical protein
MTNRRQVGRQPHKETRSLWQYLFFNPRASSSFDTWQLIFESRRLLKQTDRRMKAIMTPEQYEAYRRAGEPENKPCLLRRLFGSSR